MDDLIQQQRLADVPGRRLFGSIPCSWSGCSTTTDEQDCCDDQPAGGKFNTTIVDYVARAKLERTRIRWAGRWKPDDLDSRQPTFPGSGAAPILSLKF
jgi:hypothetical protein